MGSLLLFSSQTWSGRELSCGPGAPPWAVGGSAQKEERVTDAFGVQVRAVDPSHLPGSGPSLAAELSMAPYRHLWGKVKVLSFPALLPCLPP